jgi:hypothetical protein
MIRYTDDVGMQGRIRMSKFSSLLGGKSSTGKAPRGSISEFVKKNPDFMKLDASQRNELLINLKMESKMAELSERKGSGGFRVGGAEIPDKEMSRSAKEMMEKIIQKQLQKRKKGVVAIRACWFGNGRIAGDGKIYDADNKVVGKIDGDSLKVTIGNSLMGEYADSSYFLTKISRKIAGMNGTNASSGSGSGISLGNFYGTADTNSSGGWW